MRMKTGQFIRVFNGLDGEFVGEVHVHKKSKTKSVNIVICQHLRSADTVQNLPCVLLFAPLRRSRMKILLEKATELGIQYMIPVHTQNTQHYLDAASIDQYRKTLVQSVEQSERFFIPTLCNAVGVASVGRDAHTGTIKSNTGKDDGIQVMSQLKSILVCTERINPTAGTATSDAAAATVSATPILESLLDVMDGYGYAPPHTRVPDIALFVGPEGGFTEDEIHSLAQEDKATMVTLGRSILRAETAIISALGVVSAVFEMKSNVKYPYSLYQLYSATSYEYSFVNMFGVTSIFILVQHSVIKIINPVSIDRLLGIHTVRFRDEIITSESSFVDFPETKNNNKDVKKSYPGNP
eukprot:CAMPEP_0175024720 /NCGR_PEP_ID=MMETSP0005-20121125/16635_1 /TAXON_ID=420556 /ORGANISM="Ochromonas sp., Strain CCMP1393" /LENGTH=352 /DNA_ID=CAMNT_0016283327 /DNA_START=444 /DNA_END=1503 /DNA_ORIENTATION=-